MEREGVLKGTSGKGVKEGQHEGVSWLGIPVYSVFVVVTTEYHFIMK